MRGLQRATTDLDFILLLSDLDKADEILREVGYRRVFHNENVSHYQSDEEALGRIDILHAFRGPSMSMLERAERMDVASGVSLPVLTVEDLIGLKIQASVNDERRNSRDWQDVQEILQICGESRRQVDWELIGDYLSLFMLSDKLVDMKNWYGPAD